MRGILTRSLEHLAQSGYSIHLGRENALSDLRRRFDTELQALERLNEINLNQLAKFYWLSFLFLSISMCLLLLCGIAVAFEYNVKLTIVSGAFSLLSDTATILLFRRIDKLRSALESRVADTSSRLAIVSVLEFSTEIDGEPRKDVSDQLTKLIDSHLSHT